MEHFDFQPLKPFRPNLAPSPSPTLEGLIRDMLTLPLSTEVQEAADDVLAAVGEDFIEAMLFYGSVKNKGATKNLSYIDFFVVLKDGTEEAFYERLVAHRNPNARRWSRRLRTRAATFFHSTLVPCMYDLVRYDAEGHMASGTKICVISRQRLEQELSIFAKDNHHRARFSQPMRLVYPNTDSGRRLASHWQARAYRLTFEFVRSELPLVFSVEEYVSTFLRGSYGSEVRPESENKVQLIWAKEGTLLQPLYEEVLRERIQSGDLARHEHHPSLYVYRTTRWGFFDKLSAKAFRFRTKMRTSARWFKSMVTFQSWIDYAVEKIFRSTGYRLPISPIHRQLWPIFVVPKFLQFLLEKRRRLRKDALAEARRPRLARPSE